MRRRTMVVVAAVISIACVMGVSSSAFASKAHKTAKVTIKCSGLSGTLTGTTTLTGCKGGNTGGSSTSLGAKLASGGTITWTSGATTTVGTPTLATLSTSKCPVIDGLKASSANKVTATVTAENGVGNLPIPGTFTGAACLYSNDDVATVKPGFKIT